MNRELNDSLERQAFLIQKETDMNENLEATITATECKLRQRLPWRDLSLELRDSISEIIDERQAEVLKHYTEYQDKNDILQRQNAELYTNMAKFTERIVNPPIAITPLGPGNSMVENEIATVEGYRRQKKELRSAEVVVGLAADIINEYRNPTSSVKFKSQHDLAGRWLEAYGEIK